MFSLMNANEVRVRTTIAKEAMLNGAIVVLEKSTKKGEPHQVRRLKAADITNFGVADEPQALAKNLVLGVVRFFPDDNLAVAYAYSPPGGAAGVPSLALNTDADNKHKIPAGAAVEFIRLMPVVGVRKEDVDASIVAAWTTILEGDLITVAFDGEAHPKLALVDDAANDLVLGYVERHDGFQLSITLDKIV